MTDVAECEHCGAPPRAGLVACSYCGTPYAAGVAGVECPSCGDENLPGNLRCASCSASLEHECLFCRMRASVRLTACPSCGEVYEGAAQRLKARQEQERQQAIARAAVAGASMLGAAAASPTGRQLLSSLWDEVKDEFDD